MSTITRGTQPRTMALYLVIAYSLAASVLAGVRWAIGDGSPVAFIGQLVIAILGVLSLRAGPGRSEVMGDWLPLLSLPVLYASVPGTSFVATHHDGRVQAWDRVLFGSDAARTFAEAAPHVWLSEVLHAAYLSYYLIIYGPALLMYLSGAASDFHRTVLGFTVAMVTCFAGFLAFPVVGPRYVWPAPAGAPSGPVRSVTLRLLEEGSSRGTAFPSSHLAIALVIGLSCWAWSRRLGAAVLTATVLLGVGAVYGGFHYGTDMLAGGVVGALAWAVSSRQRVGPVEVS